MGKDDEEQEGRNLDDLLEAMFVIQNKFKKHSYAHAENSLNHWSNWLNYKTNLTGNMEKCQLIHQKVVEKLKEAMRIRKLHGNVYKNDDEKEEEGKHAEIANRFRNLNVDRSMRSDRFSRYRRPEQVHEADGLIESSNRQKGYIKSYYPAKNFGFIRMINGG